MAAGRRRGFDAAPPRARGGPALRRGEGPQPEVALGYRDWLDAREPDSSLYTPPPQWERPRDDEDAYTCVPPPGYEADAFVTEQIRVFDPGAIPIWRIQRWIAPGGEVVKVVHFGIARFSPDPKWERPGFPCLMPQGATHPAPNLLDHFFEGDPLSPTGPRETLPWDGAVVAYCRRKWERERRTVERQDALVAARLRREGKARLAWQGELDYIASWIHPWVLKKLETAAGDGDWKEYRRLLAHGAKRARQSGAWNPSRDRRRMYVV